MSAFGAGYTLPKKGKKKRTSHAHHTSSSFSALGEVQDSSSLDTTTNKKATPNKNKHRPVPHPPSRSESEDFIDTEVVSTNSSVNQYEQDRRKRVMASMLDEIDDGDIKETSTDRVGDALFDNQEGQKQSPVSNVNSNNSANNSARKNNNYTITNSNDNDNTNNNAFRPRRTISEEFGTKFRAESAGRVTKESPSARSEKSTKSTNSKQSTSSSIFSRIRGHSKSKKKKKKKKKKTKKNKNKTKLLKKSSDGTVDSMGTGLSSENNIEETESDTASDTDSDDDDDTSNPNARNRLDSAEQAMSRLQMEDLDRTKKWLNTPCRNKQKTIQCYVTRQKPSRMSRDYPMYRVFMEDTNEFVMSGKKRRNKTTSNYLITMNREKVERNSHMVVGKVRSNISGSIYHVYDHGLDATNAITDLSLRNELALVLFEYDSMGPGKVQVILPHPGDVWKPREKEEQMLSHYKNNNLERLIVGCNKRPRWDEAAGGHTLNFRGRVTEKSVKNFQIKCENISGEDTVLQFGRVDKNRFTMDFKYPLSPLQAFAICLASLDGKVSDSSALNGMKKGVRRMSSSASWLGSKLRKKKKGDNENDASEQNEETLVHSEDDDELDHETLQKDVDEGKQSHSSTASGSTGETKSFTEGTKNVSTESKVIEASMNQHQNHNDKTSSISSCNDKTTTRSNNLVGQQERVVATVVSVVDTNNAVDSEETPIRPPRK